MKLPSARFLLCVSALLAASPADAQLRSLSATSDNDAYNFWIPFATRPDEEYTNGLEMRAELAGAPLWGRLLRVACGAADGGCVSTELRVGQKIFTPRTDSPLLGAGERPYAGWLYLSAAGSVEGARVRRTGGAEVGVTGPPSQGEWVQTTFHRMAGFRDPLGWAGQLRTEPGIVIRYGEEFIAAEARPGGIRVAEVMPYWGAAAGNVRTGAHAGVRLRAGYAVPRPWGRAGRGVSLYASAGARAELVLRDLFLDGNTFRDGPRVERISEFGAVEGALGLRVGLVGVEYRTVSRTRSYETEPKGHQYGSFEVTLRTSR